MKTTRYVVAWLALTAASFAQDNSARLTLAREAIAAMHADQMIDAMLGQVKQLAAQNTNLPADATPEQRAKAQKLQEEIMEISMNSAKQLITKMDQAYADVFTESELRAIKTFYLSPEGQSMVAKQPQLMTRIMPLMQQMQQELGPKIQALIQKAQQKE